MIIIKLFEIIISLVKNHCFHLQVKNSDMDAYSYSINLLTKSAKATGTPQGESCK